MERLDVVGDSQEDQELIISLPDGVFDPSQPLNKSIASLQDLIQSGSHSMLLKNWLVFLQGMHKPPLACRSVAHLIGLSDSPAPARPQDKSSRPR